MKHIINILATYGAELRTRALIERMSATFVEGDEYLLDMAGVQLVSRSAADEIFNITRSKKVILVHVGEFVQQMLDAVSVGRFSERRHASTDVQFIKCPNRAALSSYLKTII